MSEEIILPEGYTRVTYLLGTGTQYIDLPVNTVEGDVVELVTIQRFLEISNQAEAKNGNPYFFFGINGSKWYSGCGSYGTTSAIADTDWHTFRLKYTPNSSDGGFWIDDIKYRDCDGTANVLPNYISLYKTYGGNHYTKCYKKSWKLYVNDELRYDLIPCLDNNNVPCMYDLVGSEAYYNQGTGMFDYMPVPYENEENYELPAGYTKCLYLQSDGGQYINTSIYKDISGNEVTSTEAGIIPTDETGLYIKAQALSYEDYVPFGCGGALYGIYPPRVNTKDKYIEYGWNTYKRTSILYDKGDDLIYSSSINLYNDRSIHFNSEDTDWNGYVSETLSTLGIPVGLFYWLNEALYDYPWGGRIYRAKITQGTELIRDFVPCLDASGVPCMYDLVNGGSYYNQGSGSNFEYCIDHKLPSDFIKLKYLEATGTQYINTNYVPQTIDNGDGTYTATTGLYIDAYNITVSNSLPMGCWTTSSTDTRFLAHRLHSASYNPGFGWGAWTQVTTTKGMVAYQSKLNFLNDKEAVLAAPIFSSIITILPNLSFQPTLPIYMFGINVGNTLNYNWKGRIYRAKISEGTEVVRDYVPAYDQRLARPCMYDIVNNVAYYNDGTDEFLYNRDFEGSYTGYTGLGCIGNRLGSDYNPINEKLPSEYTRVEFLESTGTQWMNTNYVPTTYSGVYVKYQATENSKSKNACWPVMSYDDSNHAIAPLTNRYGTSASLYWEIKLDPGYWTDNFSTDYIWEGTMNFYDDGITRMKVIKNGNFTQSFIMGNGGGSLRRFEYIPTDPFRICYVKWGNKGVVPWIIYNVKITEGTELKRNYIPVIDSLGTPCMYDLVTKMPLYNSGSGKFVAGLETLSHALQLKLSNNGGTITLSLPANNNITYYEEKIRNNNPNWTITFQYH